MFRRVALFFLFLTGMAAAAETGAKQPVYLFLYTRIDDPINVHYSQERMQRLSSMLEQLHSRYPQYRPSSVFQFSGAMCEALDRDPNARTLTDRLKSLARGGVLEIGYHGANEPASWTRPDPRIQIPDDPQQAWLMRGAEAENFLTRFRDPFLGTPYSDRPSGLKRMLDLLGRAKLVTGLTTDVGGDTAILHQVRKYNDTAMMFGLPDPDPARGIHGYRGSVQEFSNAMSPEPGTSPELYWDNNVLRSSDMSGAPEIRTFSASEGPEAFRTMLTKLDRSRIHIIHVEFGSYVDYLTTWHDGVPKFPPMQWAFTHPHHPTIPTGVAAFLGQILVDKNYKKIEETMRWLAEDFFPANPGSQFVSVAALQAMAENQVGKDVPKAVIAVAAKSLLDGFQAQGNSPANYGYADGRYFSLADMFQILTNALAGLHQKDSLPDSVRLTNIYGPIEMTESAGPSGQTVTVAAVARAASGLVAHLNDQTWQAIPRNAVPTWIDVERSRLNAAQFLHVMADAYLSPDPSRTIAVKTSQMFSAAGTVYPRTLREVFPLTITRVEQGNTWTFKPVPLRRAGS